MTVIREAASEILQAYYKKIGGRPSKGGKKTKRKSGVDESTPRGGRGRKKLRTEESVEDDEVPRSQGKQQKREWEPPKGSWESEVTSIDSIEEHPDPRTAEIKRYVYVMWNNGKQSRHELPTMRVKAPQKVNSNAFPFLMKLANDVQMLDFYEQHLYVERKEPADKAGKG